MATVGFFVGMDDLMSAECTSLAEPLSTDLTNEGTSTRMDRHVPGEVVMCIKDLPTLSTNKGLWFIAILSTSNMRSGVGFPRRHRRRLVRSSLSMHRWIIERCAIVNILSACIPIFPHRGGADRAKSSVKFVDTLG